MYDEIRMARRWVELRPIYLDTETTGLDDRAQACQVGVLDHDGTVLLDTLVRPTIAIPPSATAIHGITNAMVANAPDFAAVRVQLERLMTDRLVIVYNLAFDTRILWQSAAAVGCLPEDGRNFEGGCAMLLYADFRGEWDEYHHNNRWHRLERACCLEHIPTNDVRAHSAIGDCQLTRRLVNHMANAKLLWEQHQTKPLVMPKGATV